MAPTMDRRFFLAGGTAALAGLGVSPLLSACSAVVRGKGTWDPLMSWPIIAIHAAITAEGKVLSYGTDTSGIQGTDEVYDVWNPTTGGHQTLSNGTGLDLFCSTIVAVPSTDDLLTAGGDNADPSAARATRAVTLFDSSSNGITSTTQLNDKRWYATGTTLPNGKILIEGGSKYSSGGPAATTPELYTPGGGWQRLTGATSSYAYGDDDYRWWYPRSFVAPDGRIFGLAAKNMYYLNTAGSGSISSAGSFSGSNWGATASTVMFEPGKILQVGGGGESANGTPPSSAQASVIDINGGSPTVTSVSPMKRRRHWATATVLPDGKVLVTGGSEENNRATGIHRIPELWDPANDTWTDMEPEAEPRLYHSAAILLPDGRVLSAGGGAPGPFDLLNAQVFNPPYLFDNGAPSPRPSLSAPGTISYGQNFSITTSTGTSRITLLRAGSVTHSFNSGQRFMELNVSGTGTSRTVTGPANANLAPPGTYLMFALDTAGTPSTGVLIDINP